MSHLQVIARPGRTMPASIGGPETTVETVLEGGLHSLGISPVHLAIRGIANDYTIRCD